MMKLTKWLRVHLLGKQFFDRSTEKQNKIKATFWTIALKIICFYVSNSDMWVERFWHREMKMFPEKQTQNEAFCIHEYFTTKEFFEIWLFWFAQLFPSLGTNCPVYFMLFSLTNPLTKY